MLKTGQRIVAYSNINPDKKYDGEILLTGKDLDGNGIADVHCHFEKYDPEQNSYILEILEENGIGVSNS